MTLSDDDLLSVTIVPAGILVIFALALCAFCTLRRRSRNAPTLKSGNNQNGAKQPPPSSPPKVKSSTQQKETFRLKSPPSEVFVHRMENGNTPNKHPTRPHQDHHNIQMNNINDRGSNGRYENGGFDVSDLSGAHVDVEFNQAFDSHYDKFEDQNDGRLTRRSEGSNNSTIIKVADEYADTEPHQQNSFVGEQTVNPLNQTATSVKHVQLNEQSNSDLSGNQNANWNDNTKSFGNQNQPPHVDSS